MLEINLLQAVPNIQENGRIVTISSLKAQALLLYIFVDGEELYRREFLASLLWEDKDLSLAQDNLRQSLAQLKRKSNSTFRVLSVQRKHILVNRNELRLDVDALVQKIHERPEELCETDLPNDLYGMFSGFEDIGASFDSWVSVIRNEAERKISQALSKVLATDTHPAETRDVAAGLLLKLDPTNEHAVRFKMRWYAGNGQQSEALKVYNTLYETLSDNYDVDPLPETIELNAAIKLGELGPGPSQSPKAENSGIVEDARPPQIYVAKFDIDGRNPVTKRMGNLFRSDVLGNLSRFREWSVVEIETLRDSHYRLDCQIEDHLDDLAVVVTVRSVPDQRIVWSERYVTGFGNWRHTQWSIAQNLALAVNQSLTIDRIRGCYNSQLEQRGVFDKWALCHSINLDWSPDASNQVIQMLEQILETAPDFNLAHSYLAEMHNKQHLVYPGLFRSEESINTALKHARIAMTLDQLDSHAHRVFAWAKALNDEFEVAEFHFRQAYDLNPSNLYVSTSCALGFAYLDNLERACQITDRIRDMSVPLQGFQWGYLQNIYYLAGQLEDARSAGEMAGDSISNLPAWQAIIHADLGDMQRAKACMKQFLRATTDRWHGRKSPTEEAILEWLLHCFPMKNRAKRSELLDRMLSV